MLMSLKIVRLLLLLTLVGLELPVVRQLAAQQEAASQTSRTSQSVAARVDGQPIGTLRLEHELKTAATDTTGTKTGASRSPGTTLGPGSEPVVDPGLPGIHEAGCTFCRS